MIYTVTFNPALDYVVKVEHFALGSVNRTIRENIFYGGKGINVSALLANLGYRSTALGFIAGFIYASFASFFKPIRTFYQDNVIYVGGDGNRFEPARNEEVFKPEKGYQAEVGLKYQLNNILSANASLFYIRKMNSTATLTNNYQEEVNGETTKHRTSISASE